MKAYHEYLESRSRGKWREGRLIMKRIVREHSSTKLRNDMIVAFATALLSHSDFCDMICQDSEKTLLHSTYVGDISKIVRLNTCGACYLLRTSFDSRESLLAAINLSCSAFQQTKWVNHYQETQPHGHSTYHHSWFWLANHKNSDTAR